MTILALSSNFEMNKSSQVGLELPERTKHKPRLLVNRMHSMSETNKPVVVLSNFYVVFVFMSQCDAASAFQNF